MARLDDGFSTTILFSSDSDVKLWEKEVTPPGVSGGGPNDVTTMRNTAWRTMSPKALKTLSPASLVCAYDPAVLDEIVAMVGVNQLITISFPDGATWKFWGWLDAFTPNRIVEGEQPTAEVTIEISNHNNANPPVEVAPDYTAPV